MCLNFLKLNKWTVVFLFLCSFFIPLTVCGQGIITSVSVDSVKLSVADLIYDGTPKACAVTFDGFGTGTEPGVGVYEITYNAVDSTHVSPTRDSVVATFKFLSDFAFDGSVDSVTFSYEILPKVVTVDWTAPTSTVYDANSIVPTYEVKDGNASFFTDSYIISYTYNETSNIADTINVTDSNIVATLHITDSNYTATGKLTSSPYKITQKPVTLTMNPVTKSYGDELEKTDLAVTSADFISQDGAQLEYTIETIYLSGSDSGIYSLSIWPNKTSVPNYSLLDSTLFKDSLIITQKVIESDSVIFTPPENLVYNGLAKPITLALASTILTPFLVDSDYTLTYAPDSVNVGTVAVTLSLLPTGNYSAAQAIPSTYNIEGAPIKVVTPPAIGAGVSGQAVSTVAFKNSGVVKAVDSTLSQEPLSGTWAWADPSTPLALVSAVTKTATFTPVDKNYQTVAHDFSIKVYNGKIKPTTDTIYVSSRQSLFEQGAPRFNGSAPELPFYSLSVAVDYVKNKPKMSIVVDKGDYYEDVKITGHATIYGGYDFENIKTPPVMGSTTLYGAKSSPLVIAPTHKDSSVFITGLNLTRTAMYDGDGYIVINDPNNPVFADVKVELTDVYVTNSVPIKDPKIPVIGIYGKKTVVKNLLVADNQTGVESEVIEVDKEATLINPTIAFNKGGAYVISLSDSAKVYNALIQDNACLNVIGLTSNHIDSLPVLKHATIVRNNNTHLLISKKGTFKGAKIENCLFWKNNINMLPVPGTLTLINLLAPNAIEMDTDAPQGLIRLGKENKGDYGPRFVQPNPSPGESFNWQVEPGSPLIQQLTP